MRNLFVDIKVWECFYFVFKYVFVFIILDFRESKIFEEYLIELMKKIDDFYLLFDIELMFY